MPYGKKSTRLRNSASDSEATFSDNSDPYREPQYTDFGSESAGRCIYKRGFSCRFIEYREHRESNWIINLQVCLLCVMMQLDYKIYKGGSEKWSQ